MTIRIHTDQSLAAGATLTLPAAQSHYLVNVMRRGTGDALVLFNARDGEWSAAITAGSKSACAVSVAELRRPALAEPDLWLAFAPIKGDRTPWIVEKATELGVSGFWTVFTRHSVVTKVNLDKLKLTATEAAEQCERFSVPAFQEPMSFFDMLAAWPQGRTLVWCDETGSGAPIAQAAAQIGPGPAAILIGPEGGFAKSELDALRELPFAVPVGLGPRVLRADTAALAALACWQACRGDWTGRPAFRSSD